MYGPNGFVRMYAGTLDGADRANLAVKVLYDVDPLRPGITLEIQNRSSEGRRLGVEDAYGGETVTLSLRAGGTVLWHWALERSFGGYDFAIHDSADGSFEQRLAGHVETGHDSVSDPAFGS